MPSRGPRHTYASVSAPTSSGIPPSASDTRHLVRAPYSRTSLPTERHSKNFSTPASSANGPAKHPPSHTSTPSETESSFPSSTTTTQTRSSASSDDATPTSQTTTLDPSTSTPGTHPRSSNATPSTVSPNTPPRCRPAHTS